MADDVGPVAEPRQSACNCLPEPLNPPVQQFITYPRHHLSPDTLIHRQACCLPADDEPQERRQQEG